MKQLAAILLSLCFLPGIALGQSSLAGFDTVGGSVGDITTQNGIVYEINEVINAGSGQYVWKVRDKSVTNATLDNVASMVLAPLNDEDVVATRGYYSAGDGGNNEYIYHSTGKSGVTVDGGFYISGPGADDYFEAINKTQADILKFGGVMDGNTTDNQAFIQAAVNASDIIIFPEDAECRVNSSIVISEHSKKINGNGTLINYYGSGGCISFTNDNTPSNVWPVQCRVKELYIDLEGGDSTTSGFHVRTSYSVFENCVVTIRNGLADNAAIGFHLDGDNGQLNSTAGGTGPYYNQFLNCTVGSNSLSTAHVGFQMTTNGTRGPNANTFRGGRVGQCLNAWNISGIGNVWFDPIVENASSAGTAFTFDADASGNAIFGNYLENAAQGFIADAGSVSNIIKPTFLTGVSTDWTDNGENIYDSGTLQRDFRTSSYPPVSDISNTHNRGVLQVPAIQGEEDYPLWVKAEAYNVPTDWPEISLWSTNQAPTSGTVVGEISIRNSDNTPSAAGENASIQFEATGLDGETDILLRPGAGDSTTEVLRAQESGGIRLDSAITVTTGTGSPANSESANVGSLRIATDTGEVYKKQSGTGNTGWVEEVNPTKIFDGTNGFTLSAPNFGFGTGDFSVMVDALIDANNAIRTIVSNYDSTFSNGWSLRTTGSGNVQAVTSGPTQLGSSTSTMTPGTWHKIAIVRTNGSMAVWFDGTSEISFTSAGNVDNTDLLQIGNEATGLSGSDFLGQLRNIAIYDRAITANEIADYIASGTLPGEGRLLTPLNNAAPSGRTPQVEVANVAALSSTSILNDQLVTTQGYTTPGDGGGNTYRYDSGSSATIDNGFVIDGPGSVGRYIAINPLKINSIQAGLIGDDSTNNQTQFQLIATNFPDGGSLEMLDGIYQVNGEVEFSAVTDVKLHGKGTIKQTLASSQTISFVNSTNVQVQDVSFQGLGTENPWGSSSYQGVTGLHIDECTGTRIHNVTCTNHAGHGIGFSSTCRNTVVSDCTVTGVGRTTTMTAGGNGVDIAVGGTGQNFQATAREDHDLTIKGCILSEHAFGIGASRGENINIIGNIIKDIAGQHATYLDGCSKVTVTGNTISNTTQQGIRIVDSIPANVTNSFTITGNTLYNSHQAITCQSNGNTTSRMDGVVITGNSILWDGTGTYPIDPSSDGIAVHGTRSALVSNNKIQGVGRYGLDIRPGSGVFSNNYFKDIDHTAILFYVDDDSWLTNNVIVDAVQSTAATTTGRNAYTEIYDGSLIETPANANATVVITNHTMRAVAPEQAALLFSLRDARTTGSNQIRGLINETSKPWRMLSGVEIDYFDVAVSKTADWTASANLNPATPVYGRGRRILWGEDDPADAGMTDYFRPGDFCWNSTPLTGEPFGWVNIVAGSPGTWKELKTANGIETVAGLATAEPEDGEILHTAGYTTANDGGGNAYLYDASSSATVDGGFVIDGPGSVGRYLAVNQKVLNVKQWGAVGDGVTDDYTRLQAALTAAPVDGTVYFPEGDYLISNSLSVPNIGVKLYGEGKITQSAVLSPMLTLAQQEQVVDGLEFVGTETTANLAAQDLNMVGVLMGANRCTVKNCTISGKVVGIRNAGIGANISNNQLIGFLSTDDADRNFHAAIYTTSVDGDGVISNNFIDSYGNAVLVGNSSENNTIIGNRIKNCWDNGIYVSSGLSNTCIGNVISNTQGAGATGIKLRGSFNVADGNTIDTGNGVGISITPLTIAASEPAITDYQSRFIEFESGSTEPEVGSTITGQTSLASGVVSQVQVVSGSWASANAAGYIKFSSVSIDFTAGELIDGVSANILTMSATQPTIGGVGSIASNNTITDCTGSGLRIEEVENAGTNVIPLNFQLIGNNVTTSATSGVMILVRGFESTVSNNIVTGTDTGAAIGLQISGVASGTAFSSFNSRLYNNEIETPNAITALGLNNAVGTTVRGGVYNGIKSVEIVSTSGNATIKNAQLTGTIDLNNTSVRIEDCTIAGELNCLADSLSQGTDLVIKDCDITSNTDGVSFRPLNGSTVSLFEVSGCTINSVSESITYTVRNSSSTGTIDNVIFKDNTCNSETRALAQFSNTNKLVINNLVIDGGEYVTSSNLEGIYLDGDDTSGNVYIRNLATSHTTTTTSNATINIVDGFQDVTIENCEIGDRGGALSRRNIFEHNGDLIMTNCEMINANGNNGIQAGATVQDLILNNNRITGGTGGEPFKSNAASRLLFSKEYDTDVVKAYKYGATSPEGVITAGVGSTCALLGGGANTAYYIKESGSGNTGWKPVITTAITLRKEVQDTETFSATPTFDFDADTADNKIMEPMTANVTGITLTATRPGDYNLILQQDGTGTRTVAFTTTVVGTAPTVDSAADAKTLYPLYYDGATWFHK